MDFLNQIGGALGKISGDQSAGSDQFNQLAQSVSQSDLAGGLAHALGSGGTANFAQIAGNLFSSLGGENQSGMLNTILSTAGPLVLQQFLGNNPNSALAGLLSGGAGQVTAEQAASVPAEEVQALAAHVHENVPGVADALGGMLSQNPGAAQSLGSEVLGMATQKLLGGFGR